MKNLKKASLFIAITIISVFCLVFSANASWEKVSEDSNIEYYFDDVTGTLHIRGEGKIPDDFLGKCGEYVYGDDDYEDFDGADDDDFEIVEDFSYMQKVKTLIIEEGITEIGHCAFLGNYKYFKLMSELRTVVLPDSLEIIGEYAFADCENLVSVILPSSLKKVEKYAFYNTAISNINLPEGLELISSYAFCYTNISNISLPETLKTIGYYAFWGTKLKNIYVPESVNYIGEGAFNSCKSLKKITFTNAVCQMAQCDALEEIVYPADFTDFNRYRDDLLASKCPNLKKITFPSEEKEHNIKISIEDYDVFVKDCPNVTLGYVNYEMIKNQYIDYAVITKTVSKLSKVTGLKHKQKGNDNKLTWSPVEGAGYYKVYWWSEVEKKWIRVYCGADTYTTNIRNGRYKVRAVNYDGEKYVYGKYSAETELHIMYYINLVVPETTSNSATLRWSNTADQTGFQLYYSTNRNSGYKKVVTTTKRKYTVKNLEEGKTYYFKVRRYYKYPDGNIAYGSFSIIREVKL